MSATFFYNQSLDMNHLWYESHQALIMNMCIEFNCVPRMEELTIKFLSKPLKLKKVRDPDKPKRAKSGFFFFCEEKRPALMEEWRQNQGKVNIGEISKKLGKMWKGLKNRTKYDDLNANDKIRYQEAMENYKN